MTPEKKNDPAMPANWSPDSDRDQAWDAIVDLAREADSPVHPTEARYAEMLRAIRAEALPQPIVQEVAREDSFGTWARSVFLGGGPAAQLLRMAAVGTLVWAGTRGGDGDSREPVALSASTATRQVVEVADAENAREDDGFAAPVAMPRLEPTNSRSGSSVLPDIALRPVTGAVVPIPDALLVANDWREPGQSDDPAANWNYLYFAGDARETGGGFGDADKLGIPVSNSPMSMFGSVRPASARPAEQDSGALQDLVNQIQQLKFESYLDQNGEALDRIRRMESSVSRLLESDETLSGDSVAALEMFQRAEQLLAGRRYGDAVAAFRDVRRLAPGTFLAFLAQYQIAGTSFVYMRDYEAALEGYNKTLKEYPAHFISNDHNAHIQKRIEMLTQNRANGWRAVDLWQDARLSGPEARVVVMRELVQSYPESPLAAEAAMNLLEMAVGGAKPGCIEPADLIDLCATAVDDAPETNHAAVLQFVKAETIFRRLFDLERADAEFRKALEMPGADAVADQIHVRLNQIAQRGRPSEGRSGDRRGVEDDSSAS